MSTSTTDRPHPNSYAVPGCTLFAGEYPGHADPAEARRRLRQFLDAGVTSFVDLTEEGVMAPYDAILAEEAAARGLTVEYARLPIPDFDVPSPERMTEILDHIEAACARGRTVYVHCWGGVGRTGTVVGCHLVRSGLGGDEALARVADLFVTMSPEKVRRHRGGSPETHEQRAFVRAWRAAPGLRSRFRGCLLGGAVGDALGAPVEFMSLEQIRRRYGADGIAELDRAYGRVGAITDDTQMTMFTAEGLLRSTARYSAGRSWDGLHYIEPGVMAQAYRRWLATQGGREPDGEVSEESRGWLFDLPALHARRAPGTTCLSALESGRIGDVGAPLNDSKGCGGVMRVAPIGLVPTDDPFAYGVGAAVITHGHPSGYLAAGAMALIVHQVTRGAALEDAVQAALDRLAHERDHEEVSRALRAAVDAWRGGSPSAESVERLGGGWVGEEALGIAVYCALAADGDFARGVRLAVNHSGDSDSTGAIAGNILGAQLGDGAIPARWLDALELREELTALADDLLAGFRDDETWKRRYPPD